MEMNKFRIMALILLFIVLPLRATALIGGEDEEYVAFAEEMPAPIGGITAINKKISYPELAKRTGVEGKVYVLVYVNEKGKPEDAKIVKGIGAGCDDAAIEAIKKTQFTPGKNNGVPMKVKLSLCLTFKLS